MNFLHILPDRNGSFFCKSLAYIIGIKLLLEFDDSYLIFEDSLKIVFCLVLTVFDPLKTLSSRVSKKVLETAQQFSAWTVC